MKQEPSQRKTPMRKFRPEQSKESNIQSSATIGVCKVERQHDHGDHKTPTMFLPIKRCDHQPPGSYGRLTCRYVMPAMRQKDVTGAPLMVKMVFVGRWRCAKTAAARGTDFERKQSRMTYKLCTVVHTYVSLFWFIPYDCTYSTIYFWDEPGQGGDLQGSSFQPIIHVTSDLYVTFHPSLRHVSIQFFKVDLMRRQQNKNHLLK
jgi:hypothetical protein